ncbi:hypothetical protein AAHA92_00132 [Salvia divinorum]|uniref:Uncharacterized protein n=1 Tax=Salvia divinorum TaxID=28513 RepID=A0ABD1ILQ5_SALDI
MYKECNNGARQSTAKRMNNCKGVGDPCCMSASVLLLNIFEESNLLRRFDPEDIINGDLRPLFSTRVAPSRMKLYNAANVLWIPMLQMSSGFQCCSLICRSSTSIDAASVAHDRVLPLQRAQSTNPIDITSDHRPSLQYRVKNANLMFF